MCYSSKCQTIYIGLVFPCVAILSLVGYTSRAPFRRDERSHLVNLLISETDLDTSMLGIDPEADHAHGIPRLFLSLAKPWKHGHAVAV